MTLLLLMLLATCPESEISFFSDDVLEQSEQGCDLCIDPCEEQSFFSKLDFETRHLYNSLDGRGKKRAIDLWKCSFSPECAVRQAACEMARRQNGEYPFQKDYQDQIEERAGETPYTERFGY